MGSHVTVRLAAAAALVATAAATAAAAPPGYTSSGALPHPLARDGDDRRSGTCAPAVGPTYAAPPIPMHILNPWLLEDPNAMALRAASAANPSGCNPGGDELVPCYDSPAIGSGAAALGKGWFVGLTDRGPNQDCKDLADSGRHPGAEGKKGKGFPVPAFGPALVYYKLHGGKGGGGNRGSGDGARRGAVRFAKSVPLVGTNGERVSGLPNSDRDDTPYGGNCEGERLAYDVGGVDPEDVAHIPGTSLLVVVEEYAPSIMVVSATSGVILARYVPASVAHSLAGAPYPIIPELPSIFAERRKNRGFESLSVAPSGTHLYALLQSPLGDKKATGLKTSTLVRGVRMDIKVTSRTAATLIYTSQFAVEASGPAAWTAAAKQPVKPTKIKLSAAAAIGDTAFVLLERAPDQVRLYRVDVPGATTTNLDDTAYADSTALEAETGGTNSSESLGVTPVQKRLLWNSATTPGWAASGAVAQQEGLVVTGRKRSEVLLVSDNDFGIMDGPTLVTTVALGRPLDGCTICPTDTSGAAGTSVTPGACPRAKRFKPAKSSINVKKIVGKKSCWGVLNCKKGGDDN